MSFWISLLNNISVSFFGGILSASFCDALNTRKNRRVFVLCMVLMPLLLFLLRYASPVVRQLAGYPAKTQCQFGAIPMLYYGFDYLTCVYTDLLSSGDPVVVEFMPFVCCAAYLVFLLYNSVRERTQNQLKQAQKSLGIQLNQAVREIDALRESQMLASQYRHDIRHHLQYVSACIENEAANLILSAFVGRAKKEGIQINVNGVLPSFIMVSDSDLCVLLSNALENALHACEPFAAAKENSVIDVQFYNRDGRLFLQVENPCGNEVQFENGIPVSNEPGHGIGVQSICAIVERYGGMYSFLVQNHHFILRLSI